MAYDLFLLGKLFAFFTQELLMDLSVIGQFQEKYWKLDTGHPRKCRNGLKLKTKVRWRSWESSKFDRNSTENDITGDDIN